MAKSTKKKTYDDYLKICQDKNITMLDLSADNIGNIKEKIRIKCNVCGLIKLSSYFNLVHNNSKCVNCYRTYNPKTIKDYEDLEKEKQLKFLNLDPQNLLTTTTQRIIKCNLCGEESKKSFNQIQENNCGCSLCYPKRTKTIDDYIKIGKEKGIIFRELKTNFPKSTTARTKCKCITCNNKFISSYCYIFKEANPCQKCANRLGVGKRNNAKLTKNDYKLLGKENNLKFLELNKNFPKNNKTKTLVKCLICNHKWKAAYHGLNNVINCPKCRDRFKFKNEELCREFFNLYFKNNFIKIRPSWLKNPHTGYMLELDGYCEALNLAFEYQGEQHFKIVKNFKDTTRFR
jgi:hypothetical protein